MKFKTILTVLCAFAVGFMIAAAVRFCYRSLSGAASAPADQGHGHQHGAAGSSQVTVWSDRFEIFLEHPLIAVNKPTEFVTHVSDLVTLEPRRQGPVTFMLRYGSDTPITHTDPKPARAGIYIPELTFPRAGEWNVSLQIPVAGKDYIVDLPPVKVYASQAEIDHAPAVPEIEGISFLKEQQWKILSKTEPVQVLRTAAGTNLAVPESAIIAEGADQIVFVQLAGETFEEHVLELGDKTDGLVQVIAGLAEGDRVVTKGVAAVAEAQHETSVHQHSYASNRVVSLASDEIERYAIEVDTAGPGQVDVHVRLPGQIVINTDRVAHIMPNAAGVVRQVLKNVGDTVKAGEIIAWLESSELGKAKVDYLAKWAELGCCSMDLTRAQQIFDSTTALLEELKSSPSLEAIREVGGEALDANHAMLVSTYAEFVLAKSAYQREKVLFEKKVSSEKDFLTAENEYEKADAKYAAKRDSIAFEVKRNLLEAQRDLQVRQIELKGAERNLYVLGMNTEDINDVQQFAQRQRTPEQVEVCDDPNCPECVAERAAKGVLPAVASEPPEKLNEARLVIQTQSSDGVEQQEGSKPPCDCPDCIAKRAAEAAQVAASEAVVEELDTADLGGPEIQPSATPSSPDERLAWYPLRAPFDATVIEKHITLGEKLGDDSSAFTVADLRTVWVDLNVFQNDLPFVKGGQTVTISVGPTNRKIRGRISYVGPIVGQKTRTALARIVLDNTSGTLRPGTFVTADVLVDKANARVVVPKDIVQDVDDKTTVFVQTDHGFEPRAVSLGLANDMVVEIAAGLNSGDKIVTKNAFRLKAELEKLASGANAGHGHVH